MLLLIWVIVFSLVLYFYKERVFYQDSAFFLFRILNFDSVLENQRYASFHIYLPAYFAAFLQAPIKWVAAFLSLGAFIPAFLASVWVWNRFKQFSLSTMPLFCFILVGTEMFFIPVSEMNAALLWALLFFTALIHPFSNQIYRMIIPTFFVILAFNAHPGVLPLLVCIMAWIAVSYHWKKILVPGIFLLFYIFLKGVILPVSGYESGFIHGINSIEWKHLFSSWTWNYFISAFKSWMLIPALLYLFFVYSEIKQKKFRNLMIYSVTLISVTLFLILVYTNGDSDMMMQKSFSPLVFAWALPGWFALCKKPILAKYVLFCILLIWCYFLFKSTRFYSQRLDNLVLRTQPGFLKSYVKAETVAEDFPADNWRSTWAMPYESLLVSQVFHNKCQTIHISSQADSVVLKQGRGIFYGAGFAKPMQVNELNQKYFQMSDTGNYYFIRFGNLAH